MDLSHHLHTAECNVIIRAYQQCQTDHPFRSYVGFCNPLYYEMTKCLKKERIAKRDANYPKHMWNKEEKYKDFDYLASLRNKNKEENTDKT